MRFLVRSSPAAKFEYLMERAVRVVPNGKPMKTIFLYWVISPDAGRPIGCEELDPALVDKDYREASESEREGIALLFQGFGV